MGLITINQEGKIKLYSKLLDIKKKNTIIKILKLFYDTFSFEYNTSVVDWLDNQIAFFLSPYNFNEKNKRNLFMEKLDSKLTDCEYNNASLDKIILELFSWTNNELEIFYKNNQVNSKNKEKSVYNIGLRKKNQNGGGSSNDYVLKYINALKNDQKFNKTKLIFNYLEKIIIEKKLSNFIENFFPNINEIYIDNNTPNVSIEKLFLYLLNSSNKYLDKIITEQKKYFTKFIFNKKISSSINNINDKEWIFIKNNFDKYNYQFYKIFNNKLVISSVLTSDNKYITRIFFQIFDSNIINYDYKKINYYYYFSILNSTGNKTFKIYNKNNKNSKKILLNASKDFIKKFIKNT
jgi:hypothetical protein